MLTESEPHERDPLTDQTGNCQSCGRDDTTFAQAMMREDWDWDGWEKGHRVKRRREREG